VPGEQVDEQLGLVRRARDEAREEILVLSLARVVRVAVGRGMIAVPGAQLAEQALRLARGVERRVVRTPLDHVDAVQAACDRRLRDVEDGDPRARLARRRPERARGDLLLRDPTRARLAGVELERMGG